MSDVNVKKKISGSEMETSSWKMAMRMYFLCVPGYDVHTSVCMHILCISHQKTTLAAHFFHAFTLIPMLIGANSEDFTLELFPSTYCYLS